MFISLSWWLYFPSNYKMCADLYWNIALVWRPSRSPDGFHRYLLIGPMLGEGTQDFGGAGGLNVGVCLDYLFQMEKGFSITES